MYLLTAFRSTDHPSAVITLPQLMCYDALASQKTSCHASRANTFDYYGLDSAEMVNTQWNKMESSSNNSVHVVFVQIS